jgi:hypothetical protein
LKNIRNPPNNEEGFFIYDVTLFLGGDGGGANFTFFGFGGGGGSGLSAGTVLDISSFGFGGGDGGIFDFVCALTIPPINKAISIVNVFFIKEI